MRRLRSAGRSRAYVARVRSYLDTVPPHHVAMPELADLAGVSISQLAHRFRDEVGTPPLAYLTRVRVERALRLLRHVKRLTGLTPTQYAGLHRGRQGGSTSNGR